MRLSPASLVLAVLALASAERLAAPIYIQPVGTASEATAAAAAAAPSLLAEISYAIDANADGDTRTAAEAEITAYEAPELPEEGTGTGTGLVRIGVYDAHAGRWASSTSVASVANFAKGYSPHVVLSVAGDGTPLGASVRGVRIDAGQTRDFGPQARVVVVAPGKQPELNRPVVLSPEGKKVEPEEKSFFQKYWWLLAIGALLLVSGGGGEQQK